MKKVLYVEDDAINAFVFSRLLRREYEVLHFEDGESLVAALDDLEFDIAFLDINLGSGKMDGTEVMKKIKQHPKFSRLPTIALTAFAFHEDELKFLEDGFDYYLSKPLKQAELIELIENNTSST